MGRLLFGGKRSTQNEMDRGSQTMPPGANDAPVGGNAPPFSGATHLRSTPQAQNQGAGVRQRPNRPSYGKK